MVAMTTHLQQYAGLFRAHQQSINYVHFSIPFLSFPSSITLNHPNQARFNHFHNYPSSLLYIFAIDAADNCKDKSKLIIKAREFIHHMFRKAEFRWLDCGRGPLDLN
jgi:hypothetical protein